jgi:hypothetical protein
MLKKKTICLERKIWNTFKEMHIITIVDKRVILKAK